MKRFISLLCVVAMLITLIACAAPSDVEETEGDQPSSADTSAAPEDQGGASDESAATTEAATTPPPSAFESAPREDLGGYVFSIRYPDFDSCYTDFHAENMTGEILNDAIYDRNIAVEDALSVTLDISWDAYAAVNESLRTQVNSGDHSYDLFASQRSCLALSHAGLLYNVNNISTMRLEEEWWDQGFIDNMTINDKLYCIVGDISVASMLFVSSLTFNKELLDSYGLTMPYDVVRQGKWTVDGLQTLLANTAQDLNSDDKMTPDDDRFSLVGWGSEAGYSLFYSTGFKFVNRNSSGDLVLEYDDDRLVGIIERLLEVWNPATTYFNNGSGRDQHAATWKIFSDGRAVCADIVLSKIGTYFSAMDDDYGIVPMPKLDENQEEYVTYSGFTVPIMMIPANEEDAERTGLIMEALGSASYDMVSPKLLEIVTKIKNVRDEDSSEMINIIVRNKIFDTAHFFDLPGFGGISRTLIANQTTNVTSLLKTQKRVAQTQWDRICASFDKLG